MTGAQPLLTLSAQYTAGTGDWDAVVAAFVDGWAAQYAAEHA